MATWIERRWLLDEDLNEEDLPLGQNCASVTVFEDEESPSDEREPLVFVFGGMHRSRLDSHVLSNKSNSLYCLNTKTRRVSLVTPRDSARPPPRACHAAAAVRGSQFGVCLAVFGGLSDEGRRLNDTWLFNLRTWRWTLIDVSGDVPVGRSHHTCNGIGARLVCFGGMANDGTRLNDLAVLDVDTATWSIPQPVGPIPRRRLGHSAVVAAGKLCVFGGYDGRERFQDLVLFDLALGRWSAPIVQGNSPIPRYGHSCVILGDKLCVLGGSLSGEPDASSVSILDLGSMTWVQPKIEGPLPIVSYTCAFVDTVARRLIVWLGNYPNDRKRNFANYLELDTDSVSTLRRVRFDEAAAQITNALESLKSQGGQTSDSHLGEKLNEASKLMREQFEALLREKEVFDRELESQWSIVRQRQRMLDTVVSRMESVEKHASNRVKLNVGGTVFETTFHTMVKFEHTLFHGMFGGRFEISPDKHDGSFFIDRDPTHFRFVLILARRACCIAGTSRRCASSFRVARRESFL